MKLKNLCIVLFLILTGEAMGQLITGTVSTDSGPIPGASIIVKGTAQGVVSDFDGVYSLENVKKGDIIQFSYVGFQTKEVTFTGQEQINVTLTEDLVSLDEVVIVNYGKQKNIATSVVSSEELSEFPVTDIGQALQGRAAGVNITNGGSPGSQTLVQIRGVNTFGDGRPLFVVDGVFVDDINTLDLASIEKIDILKDAASTSIYGSRGTNGVVLITTKKGRVGKTSFSLNASSGIQEFHRRYDLMNTEQYIQFLREVNALTGQNGGPDNPIGRINDDPSFDGNGVDTDWQDAYFRQAPIYNINGNVNGGKENVRFNVGFSHFDQEGIFIDTGFERSTLNVNTDANIGDWLNIGQTLSLAYTETVLPESAEGRDPLQNIIGQAPYIPILTEEGRFGGTTGDDLNDSRNQIRIQNSNDNLNRNSNVIGSIFADFKIVEGLTFRTQYGLNASQFLQDRQRRSFAEAGGRFVNPINFIDKTRQTIFQTVFTNTLSFDRTLGKHSVNASAVLEQTKFRLESASISDNNDLISSIPEAFSPNARATSFTIPDNLNSILFLAGYEFENRYTLSGSARRDSSSKFSLSLGNATDWFYSASFGWQLSNEPWFNVEAINNLKFRASYGESGNNAIGRARGSVNLFEVALGVDLPYVINGETVPGVSPNRIANPAIRWENQTKQNYGMNLGLLNNQIKIDADYFINRSESLLIPVNAPPSAGIPGSSQQGVVVIRNVGATKVEGFELSLGYNDYEGDFTWSFWANATTTNNIVERLSNSGEPIERARLNPPFASAINRLAVGEAPFHFFGLVADGVFSTQDQIDSELSNNSQSAVPLQPGDVRFRDLNGDGQITLEDRAVIGNPNPDFTYAINIKAQYKGWDFDVLFNGVQGVDAFNSNTYYLEGLDNGLNYSTRVIRRWQNPGDITDIPRFRFGSNLNNEISTRYIEDASYLRLRNATVGYTIPNRFFNKSGKSIIKKLRIYVQGQNLLTLTNYTGLDPEIAPFYNAQGLVDGLGIDRSAQPRPLTVLSGIQIEF